MRQPKAVWAEVHANGCAKWIVYDVFAQQLEVTDELGDRARMAYDAPAP